MKQYKQGLFTGALVVLVLLGCKKDDPNPTQNITTTPPSFSTPQPTDFGGPAPSNVLAAIRTVTTVTLPVVGTQYVDANTGAAIWKPGKQTRVISRWCSGTDYAFTKTTAGSCGGPMRAGHNQSNSDPFSSSLQSVTRN